MSITITAGHTPRIHIETLAGDLSLVGWDSGEILLKGDEESIHHSQDGDRVTVRCEDDLALRVPRGASVSIQSIEGDASIRGLQGRIELTSIGGDLSLRDIADADIGTVGSDLTLRGGHGNLAVRRVEGDASIREVEGSVVLESVADDLALRDVRENVTANVGEDVVLYLVPRPGFACTITAGEDILLVMPPSADATLTLNADAIDFDWRGVENEADATSRIVQLGEGSAAIQLTAGGDIRVSNQANAGESAEEWGNFAAVGFDWSGFGEHLSRQVEQATRRAARHAEDAARRASRRMDARLKVGIGRWNWDLAPKGAPLPPRPAVSEEERMAILKMLQEKRITADEADRLLAALEGEA